MTEQPEPWARVIAHNVLLAEHVHGIHAAAHMIERAVEQRVADALAEREAAIVAWGRSVWRPENYPPDWPITRFLERIEAGEHLPKGGEHE